MTLTLASQEPVRPVPLLNVALQRTLRRPWVHYRDPGCLALLLEGLRLRGRRALYAGTHARLLAIATDPRLQHMLPRRRRWELPPILKVVQAARRGIPQVLRGGAHDLSVIGMMCLPPKAAEALLNPAARGEVCLVVDGIDYNDPDEGLAAAGLDALAQRTGAAILVLP